jgi:putative membrane protein insertion efficiency factor
VPEHDARPALPTRALIAMLRAYKAYLSPLLPPACRFHPTCSEYMAEALQVHGLGRGLWLGVRRLSRCHPWHPGGFDPVPPQEGEV